MKTKYYCLAICLLSLSWSFAQNKSAPDKSAPFSKFIFEGENILIDIDREKMEWIGMRDVPIHSIILAAKSVFEDKWQEGIAEDLVEILRFMNLAPQESEEFTFLSSSGETIKRTFEFTREKRERSKRSFRKRYKKENGVIYFDPNEMLTKAQMLADIDELDSLMHTNFSYFKKDKLDTEALFESVKENLPPQQSAFDFGLVIMKVIKRFGDGHARSIDPRTAMLGCLPFKTVYFKGKVVCHRYHQLLEPDFPYLSSINGISVDDLLAVSKQYFVPKITKETQDHWSVHGLSQIGLILKLLGQNVPLKFSKTNHLPLVIELQNDKGEVKRIERGMVPARRIFDKPNPFTTKILGDSIAYIKIDQMASDNPEVQIKEMMDSFSNPKAFIIDIRNNSGGKRHIGQLLIPYFMPPAVDGVVGNLVKYRTDDLAGRAIQAIEDRQLHHISSEKLSDKDRMLIRAFMKDFEPKHNYDTAQFSDWHYFLIRAKKDAHFRGMPVVVLMNNTCFSASDIFLSSFDQLENVTLIGTKSGGGSGRTRRYELSQSKIRLALSSLISFQPNGHLYDGRGVYPDIEVEQQQLSDILGKTDYQLNYAIEYLMKK